MKVARLVRNIYLTLIGRDYYHSISQSQVSFSSVLVPDVRLELVLPVGVEGAPAAHEDAVPRLDAVHGRVVPGQVALVGEGRRALAALGAAPTGGHAQVRLRHAHRALHARIDRSQPHSYYKRRV